MDLLTAVTTYATAREASRVLAGWGGGRAVVGDGARIAVGSKGRRFRAVAAVLMGDAVGFVQFSAPGGRAAVYGAAREYLSLLASRILRLRGRPGEGRILTGIRPDGSVPPRVALQEFALLYGPLPGVPQPAGSSAGDGTIAIGMVLANMAAFTADQRRVINQRLRSTVAGAPRNRSRGVRAAVAAPIVKEPPEVVLTPAPQFEGLADGIAASYAAKLGMVLPFPVRTYTVSGVNGDLGMDATPTDNALNDKPDSPDQCTVSIFPRSTAESPADFKALLAHEVFFCFEYAIQPASDELGNWIRVGMAHWAALDILYNQPPDGNLMEYFATPGTSLLQRSFDAAGFWGAVDEYVPGGLWPRVRSVLQADPRDGHAAFARPGGDSADLLQTVPSEMARLGPAWHQSRPRHIAKPAPFELLRTSTPVMAPAFTHGLYEVSANTGPQLVHITVTSGFMRGATTVDAGDVNGKWFCLGGECKCQAGEISSIPEHPQASGATLLLGLNGGSKDAEGFVEVHDLAEYCKAPFVRGVTLYRGTGHLHVLAVFKDAKCLIDSSGFVAKATDRGYTLLVNIARYDGPHTYDIHQGGTGEDPFAAVLAPSGARYSNLFPPSVPTHGFGQIKFDGTLVGVGYMPAFTSSGSVDDAVTFTGVMQCHYPKKR